MLNSWSRSVGVSANAGSFERGARASTRRGSPPPGPGGGARGAPGGLGGLTVGTCPSFGARAGARGVGDGGARVPAADRRVGDFAEPRDQPEPLSGRDGAAEDPRAARAGRGRRAVERDLDAVVVISACMRGV